MSESLSNSHHWHYGDQFTIFILSLQSDKAQKVCAVIVRVTKLSIHITLYLIFSSVFSTLYPPL